MAATETIEVVYRGWEGGEFGTIGPVAAPKGTFHAKNLVRSPAGLLVPRHGTEGAYVKTSLPNGVVHALGWTGVPTRDLWALVGANIYTKDSTAISSGAWVAVTGALTGEPNEQVPYIETQPGITYLIVPGQGLYRLDLATGAPGTLTKIAAVSSTMAGRGIAVWGERLFIGGWNPGNRVYYSEAGDFSTWPVANFFKVGPAPEVRVVLPQRQSLSIALQDGSWYVFNGSTPTTGTLRRVVAPQGTWHFWTNSAALLPNDQVWLVPPQGTWPALMDGVEINDLSHLEYAARQGNVAGEQNVVAPLRRRTDVAFISGLPAERGDSMIQLDGVFTYHEIGGSIAGGTAVDGQGHVWLHDGGAAGAQANIYRLWLDNDGLPGGSGTHSRVGDASSTPLDTYLELPMWFAEDGHEYRVRQVIVDFKKFDLGLGAGVDNELSIVVDAYGRNEFEGPVGSAQQSMLQPTNQATAAGVRDRMVANVGDQGYGGGFQIRFPQLTGVGIDVVTVHLERAGGRPRS